MTRIAFYRYTSYGTKRCLDLFAIDSDGTNETQLIPNPYSDKVLYDNSGPFFDAQKQRILFTRGPEASDHYDVYVLDLNTNGLTKIPNTHRADHAHWVENSSLLLCSGWSPDETESRIFTIRMDGMGLTYLTGPGTIDTSPVWNRAATKVAFVRIDYGQGVKRKQVWTMDADGANAVPVLPNDAVNRMPTWSPDGTHLAFQRYQGGQADVWTIDLATRALTNLTNGPAVDGSPVWSDAGILFASNRGCARGNQDLFTMNADGGSVRRVKNTPESDVPCDW